MSKKTKLKNREKRLQEKRARKAANKARYAEMHRLGIKQQVQAVSQIPKQKT